MNGSNFGHIPALLIWSNMWKRSSRILAKNIKLVLYRPTVCLGVTSAVVYTYGCGDGRIGPTRCAVIDAGRGDRWSPRRACRRPPTATGSGRIVLAAGLRPALPAAPGGSP